MIDGVYVDGEAGPQFVAAPILSDDDVQQIVETTARRVVRLLQRRGLLEEGHVDPLWEQEPLLATITAASIQGQVATGERAGQPVRRRLLDPQEGIRTGPLCFASRGFSLHAATRVPAADRTRLERLCRYVNRPPLAAGRLQILDAEQVATDLKTRWSDGTRETGRPGAATAPQPGALPWRVGTQCGRSGTDCTGSQRRGAGPQSAPRSRF